MGAGTEAEVEARERRYPGLKRRAAERCGHPGCRTILNAYNNSGRCWNHRNNRGCATALDSLMEAGKGAR